MTGLRWGRKAVFAISMALLPTTLATEVIDIHGSGTTNPSKCYWLIMSQITDRAKPPLRLTYRAVGSSTGQKEFLGVNNTGTDAYVQMNDFGSGDIPIPTAGYEALTAKGKEMVHLPFVLGAISFFHSFPGIKSDGLNMTACTLAKAFRRKIVYWDDDEILRDNPNLEALLPYKNYPIQIAHRVLGSSSTKSITQYLNYACPEEWPENLVGSTIVWEEDTLECQGSAGMVECLKDNPGAIGYADSGHGIQEGLREVELKNADGNWVSSAKAAENGGIGSAAVNTPDRADMDFGAVNLVNQPGKYTWPIVAMSYVYVRKDLSFLTPEKQSLLKYFLQQLYEEDSISQCKQFGFVLVPDSVKSVGLAGIDMLQINSTAPTWITETETLQGTGQGDYVISSKRKSYPTLLTSSLSSSISTLTSRTATAEEEALTAMMQEQVSNMMSGNYATFTQKEMTMIRAGLAMGAISMIMWVLVGGMFVAKRVFHI